MPKHNLPTWLYRHVQTCRAAFGIGYTGFDMTVRRVDKPANTDGCLGETTTEPRYDRAGVDFARTLRKTDLGYEVVTHEVLHAATGAQRQAVNQIIALLPEDQRDYAEALWQDGNEATITRLARALTPLLRSMKHD